MKRPVFRTQVRSLFDIAEERTRDYVFDVDGLVPDAAIAEFVKQQLKRPGPMDDEAYLERVRNGELRLEAARSIGLDTVAVFRRLQVDRDFAERVRVAELESLEPAEKKLRELAEDGDIRALERLLAAKNTQEYGTREKDRKATEPGNTAHADDPIDNDILQLEAEIRNQQQARNLIDGESQWQKNDM